MRPNNPIVMERSNIHYGWIIVNEDSDGYDLDLVFNETAYMIDLSSNAAYTLRISHTPA